MTPREFANTAAGISRKRTEDYMSGWEQTRFLAFSIMSPYMKKKNASPQDVLKFPWEKVDEAVDLEQEILAVERQRDFWKDIDDRKKALN